MITIRSKKDIFNQQSSIGKLLSFYSGEIKNYPELIDKNFCVNYIIEPSDKKGIGRYYNMDTQEIDQIDFKQYGGKTCIDYNIGKAKFMLLNAFHLKAFAYKNSIKGGVFYKKPYNNNSITYANFSKPLDDSETNEFFNSIPKAFKIGQLKLNVKNISEYFDLFKDHEYLEPLFERLYNYISNEALKIDLKITLSLNPNMIKLLESTGYNTIVAFRMSNIQNDESFQNYLREKGFTQHGNFMLKLQKGREAEKDIKYYFKDTLSMKNYYDIKPYYFGLDFLKDMAKNYIKTKPSENKKSLLSAFNGLFKHFLKTIDKKTLEQTEKELIFSDLRSFFDDEGKYLIDKDNEVKEKNITNPIEFGDDKETQQTTNSINYLFLLNNITYNVDVKLLNQTVEINNLGNAKKYYVSLNQNISDLLNFLEKTPKFIDMKEYKHNILKSLISINEALQRTAPYSGIFFNNDKIVEKLKNRLDKFLQKFSDVVVENGKLDVAVARNRQTTAEIINGLCKVLSKNETNIQNTEIKPKKESKTSFEFEFVEDKLNGCFKVADSRPVLNNLQDKEDAFTLLENFMLTDKDNTLSEILSNKQNVVAYRFRELVQNLDFQNMSKEDLAIKTAISLAITNGFLGSVKYSTLQHSLNVYKIVSAELERDKNLNDIDKKDILLKALFHDAVEAIVLGDIPTPIKDKIPNYYQQEKKFMNTIFEKLGVKDTEYNDIIDIADRLERNTFMQMHFSNAQNLVNAADIYMQNIESKVNLSITPQQRQEILANIVLEYSKFLKSLQNGKLKEEAFTNISFLTYGYMEMFHLSDPMVLSKDEFKDYGLSMKTNVKTEEVLKEFAKIARSLDLDITDIEILEKYEELNDMPEKINKLETYSKTQDALQAYDIISNLNLEDKLFPNNQQQEIADNNAINHSEENNENNELITHSGKAPKQS